MGTGAVSVSGVDVTDYIDREQSDIEFQASKLNGIAKLLFRDENGSLLGLIKERAEVIVTDDGSRIFGGQIGTLKPDLDAGAVIYTAKCQSFDCLLDFRIIPKDGTGVRDRSGGDQYDDDDVQWIIAFGGDLGLTASTHVSRVRVDPLPSIDYGGMTLRQALEHLGTYTTGAIAWVDSFKDVYWTDPQSAQKVQNPDFEEGSTNWGLTSATTSADSGPGGTGDECVVITTLGGTATQLVTGLTGNRRYLIFADVWGASANGATVSIDWQDAGSVSQRVDTFDNDATTSDWVRQKVLVTAPAAATKALITLELDAGVEARFDNINLVGEDAAFGVSTDPNGTTTRRMWKWNQPSDAANPINRVYVQGNGIGGWREHAASIAYFGGRPAGVFEGYLEDDRVTTEDGIDSRAAYVFRKSAFPAHSGSYMTDQSGLEAGTWQIIEVPQLGLQAIEWIATIKSYFTGDGQMEYEITYGAPEDDLGAVLVAMGSAFSGAVAEVGVENPVIPGSDANPPAVPSNLALSTGQAVAPDGTHRPYLLSTWDAVGDVDLDAYELQHDRAIEGEVTFSLSASGTGGALPAGEYAVQITGVGSEGGETGVTSDPQVITITAGQHIFVTITAKPGIASYNVYATILAVGEVQPKKNAQSLTTTGSPVEISSAGAGVTPPTSSTAVSFTNPTTYRTAAVSHYTENAQGGVYYAARVRAVDLSGNESAWSSPVGIEAGDDTSAPAIPTGVALSTGFRLIGVRWTRNPEPDIGLYQVRYAPEDSVTPDTPDTTAWVPLSTASNWALLDGLDPEVTYFVQVRSVDRSGNVVTSAVDSTAVNADENPEAGWSNDGTNEAYVSAQPVFLSGQSDIAFGTIVSDHIAATGIDASKITAGTLAVGGQPNTPEFFLVYDASGQEIGRWDANGLLVTDPDEPLKQVRIMDGAIEFSEDGGTTWTTAISGDGVVADAIRLGTAPGGHNNVPNASFELAEFASALTKVWTSSTDWGTTIGTDVNVDKTTADLKLTSFSF